MNEILTPERVMEIGEEWKRIFLHNLSPEEIDAYINPEYKQNVIEQGIEQGEIVMSRTIEQILQRRFGSIPDVVTALLTQCKLAELNDLVNPALDAVDLAAFLSHLPRKA